MDSRYLKYNHLLSKLEHETVGQRLEQVNMFFNNFRYQREITDYWKCTPEFLNDGCGDCDDFAISKYFLLLKLNINKSKLRIAYANIVINGIKEAHMVILYKRSKKLTIILDNYDPKIHRLDNRKNLEIVYTFDSKYVYFQDKRYVNNLKKWAEVLNREEALNSHKYLNEVLIDNKDIDQSPNEDKRQQKNNNRLSPDD
jgi:predicted transglutaminase-like cysteine proteinase